MLHQDPKQNKVAPTPFHDSFVSEAIDFDTFEKLGFADAGDSGMLIRDDAEPEKKKTTPREPTQKNERLDTKVLNWASS